MTTINVVDCSESEQYKEYQTIYFGKYAEYILATEMHITVKEMAATVQAQFQYVWDYWKGRGSLGAQCSDFTCNFALAFAHNVSKVGLKPYVEPALS